VGSIGLKLSGFNRIRLHWLNRSCPLVLLLCGHENMMMFVRIVLLSFWMLYDGEKFGYVD